MLKEILVEVLPDVLEEILSPYAHMSDIEKYINETIGEDSIPTFVENTNRPRPTINRSMLTSGGEFYDKQKPVSTASKPTNERGIVNGESYASGQGLLEWFKKEKPSEIAPSEFTHASGDVDALIKRTVG